MEIVFGSTIQSQSGLVATSSLDAPFTLIYFSNHNFAPCRTFTPKLANFYKQVNTAGKQVDIVFVSMHRAPDQFFEYFPTMPWHNLPNEDIERARQVFNHFHRIGIPDLILIDSLGRCKEDQCREMVENKGPECLKVWYAALRKY